MLIKSDGHSCRPWDAARTELRTAVTKAKSLNLSTRKKNTAEEGAREQLIRGAAMKASGGAWSLCPAPAIWGSGMASLVHARLARSLPAQPSLYLHRVYFDPKSREFWAYLCCRRRPAVLSTHYRLAQGRGCQAHTPRPTQTQASSSPRPEHKWSSSCLRDVWEPFPRVLSMSELCLPFPGTRAHRWLCLRQPEPAPFLRSARSSGQRSQMSLSTIFAAKQPAGKAPGDRGSHKRFY